MIIYIAHSTTVLYCIYITVYRDEIVGVSDNLDSLCTTVPVFYDDVIMDLEMMRDESCDPAYRGRTMRCYHTVPGIYHTFLYSTRQV